MTTALNRTDRRLRTQREALPYLTTLSPCRHSKKISKKEVIRKEDLGVKPQTDKRVVKTRDLISDTSRDFMDLVVPIDIRMGLFNK